jgi:hypothetical protein
MYKMKEEMTSTGHLQNEVANIAGSNGPVSSYQIISIPHSHPIQVPSEGNYYQQTAQSSSLSATTTTTNTQRPSRKRIALEGGAQMQSMGQRGRATQLVIDQG